MVSSCMCLRNHTYHTPVELIRSVMDGRGKSFNLALDSANQTLEKVNMTLDRLLLL